MGAAILLAVVTALASFACSSDSGGATGLKKCSHQGDCAFAEVCSTSGICVPAQSVSDTSVGACPTDATGGSEDAGGTDAGSPGGLGGRCTTGALSNIPLQWQGAATGGGMNAAWQLYLMGGTANIVRAYISGMGPGGGTLVAILEGGRTGCLCRLTGSASESLPNAPGGRRYTTSLEAEFRDAGGTMVLVGTWQLSLPGTNFTGSIQGTALAGSGHIDTSVLPIPPGTGGTEDAGSIPPSGDPGHGFDPGVGAYDPGHWPGTDPGHARDPGMGGHDPGHQPGTDPGGPSDPCMGVSFAGCCAGNTLKYCEEVTVKEVTCPTTCGWDGEKGFYNCDHEGPDPSGEFTLPCP